jgi:hypothetical protein
MGDLYWKGSWHAALNSYWPPLYGWLTGGMLLLTRPTMRWEYPAVHLLTFVILLATMLCFEFFWRELLVSQGNTAWVGPLLPRAWVLGYLLFAYIHLAVHRLLLITPDLLVAALLYLALGMMLLFARGHMGTASAFLLGVLLGVGYLTKTAMLPFAAVFILTMAAVAWKRQQRKSLIAAALLGCLLTCLPFIAALSGNAHRFTYGDAAKINQGWCVNGVTPAFRHWQGNGPGHERAPHPTRKIHAWPEIYEFAAPVAGTYPVWYDPSYWYTGLDSSMHPGLEVRAFMRNMAIFTIDALLVSGFLVSVALMFILGGQIGDSCRNLLSFWPILVPAAAVLLMYMMVHWETRYTTGIMLVMWGAAIASTNISAQPRKARVFWAASLLLGALIVGRFSIVLIEDYRASAAQAQTIRVAERLRTMGIVPGTPIALIGDGDIASCWARLGRLKIVAEVPHVMETGDSASAFWNSSPQDKTAVLNVLKNTGASAVVADAPPAMLPPEWLPLGNTGRAVYFFP